jgi:Family of unknown function (DUF6516)
LSQGTAEQAHPIARPRPTSSEVGRFDNGQDVGTIANVKATLITRLKDVTPEGSVIELVVWRVPRPVPPSRHDYKYRAAYVVDGVRIVGFDNERGKGDHCHIGGRERAYTFVSVEQLIEDFIAAVDAARTER